MDGKCDWVCRFRNFSKSMSSSSHSPAPDYPQTPSRPPGIGGAPRQTARRIEHVPDGYGTTNRTDTGVTLELFLARLLVQSLSKSKDTSA